MIGEPATVFLVDDDESVRRSVDRLLRTAGFRVRCFAGVAEFLAEVEPCCRGCVVLDVRMPGQSGFDLYDRLTTEGHNLGIIFITGHADFQTAVRSLNADASHFQFLAKPFEADALIAAVSEALR
jgi:two-component system, LuxR family, response regulator FixJ